MNFLDKRFNKSTNSIDKSSLNLSHNQTRMEALTAVCQSHPSQVLSNYCTNSKCLMPLCPQCIQVHLQQHKRSQQFPQIQSIKNARVKCIRKVHKLSQLFSQQLSSIDSPKSIQKICQQTVTRLGQIKAYMVQTIDSYFNSLEDTIKIRVKESAAVLKQMDSIHHRMRQILEELAALDDKLQGNTQATVPTIRRVFSLDGNGLSETFMMELNNYAGIRKKAHIDIAFDEGKFRQGLADCVSFEKPVTDRSMNPTNNLVPPSPRPPRPITPTSQHSHVNFTQFAHSNNQLVIRDKMTLGTPTLHFFEGCSKNLHLISLPSLTRQVVTLRSSYQIPQHHKSICTSTGQLIISGGLFDEDTKNRFVGKYDLQKKTFNDQFAVVLQRSSHSLCQLDGYVYIVGGLGTDGGQRNVQKVNLRTGQVQNQTPSKYSGNNICIALSTTKQIIKLCVQGIQIYQTTRKVWTNIVVPNYIYYQSCAAIDINDNQIFVFGGYNKLVPEGQQGVTASHTFDITDRSNITIGNVNKFSLPLAQGFWNNIPTIYKRQIYALQNIQNQQSQDCIENQRNVLRFDGVTWSVL